MTDTVFDACAVSIVDAGRRRIVEIRRIILMFDEDVMVVGLCMLFDFDVFDFDALNGYIQSGRYKKE